MKKLSSIILVFLLLLPLTLATTLNVGDSTQKSGKVITLTGVGEDKAVFDVDGVGNIVNLNKSKNINGATIEVSSVQYNFDPKQATFTVTVKYVCGDNVCEGEESTTCCKDCGCDDGLKCTENRCINPKDNKCNKNTDCNDNDETTIDICSGVPTKCSHKEATCKQDLECDDQDKLTQDTCVNNLCSFVLYSDLAECKKDEDCNDDISCTKDKCEGLPLKCVNEEITTCGSYDDCCPPTCSYPDDLNCKGVKESDDSQFDELIEEENILNEDLILEEETNTTEKILDDKEDGFFKKIISWFKKLFN